MLDFFMYLVGGAISIFALAFSIRYGLKGAGNWDSYVASRKYNASEGFGWYYRMPLSIGVVPEYYFFLVLGRENYFKRNWWALRTAAFVTFLLFIPILTNNSTVQSYYSFKFIAEEGISAFFTSGVTFWYLNMLNTLYATVFVMITIESIKMQGWYAAIRIPIYTTLTAFLSVLTLIVLSGIIALTVLYIAYKLIKLFFFKSKKGSDEDYDDDSTNSLKNKYRLFRAELLQWEKSQASVSRTTRKVKKPKIKRKRPKVEREPKAENSNDDIPRFHPD